MWLGGWVDEIDVYRWFYCDVVFHSNIDGRLGLNST